MRFFGTPPLKEKITVRLHAHPCSSIILIALLALAGCSPALTRDGLPPHGRGTFARDENGFPSGTGWQAYLYPTGQVKLREAYVEGVLQRSIWYRPDGSIVATTDWQRGSGTGYELRDDGSILWKKGVFARTCRWGGGLLPPRWLGRKDRAVHPRRACGQSLKRPAPSRATL